MSKHPPSGAPKRPPALISATQLTTMRALAKRKMSDLQLDGLAFELYHADRVSELTQAQTDHMISHLQTWLQRERDKRVSTKDRYVNDRKRGAA